MTKLTLTLIPLFLLAAAPLTAQEPQKPPKPAPLSNLRVVILNPDILTGGQLGTLDSLCARQDVTCKDASAVVLETLNNFAYVLTPEEGPLVTTQQLIVKILRDTIRQMAQRPDSAPVDVVAAQQAITDAQEALQNALDGLIP